MAAINNAYKSIKITPADRRMALSLETLKIRNNWVRTVSNRAAFINIVHGLKMANEQLTDAAQRELKTQAARFWDGRLEDENFNTEMDCLLTALKSS